MDIVTTPVFLLFIAFSFLLSYGYFWGRRRNDTIFRSAFKAMVETAQPADQTFTVIGGVVGYHANLVMPKQHPLSQIDATITLLPRHSWLYLPLSWLVRRFDRLFITFHCRARVPGEGHVIESAFARFRGPKITGAERLTREDHVWGKATYHVYYDTIKTRDFLMALLGSTPDPGVIRHIALVPKENRGFVFMIPRLGKVEQSFAPLYRWFIGGLKNEEKGSSRSSKHGRKEQS